MPKDNAKSGFEGKSPTNPPAISDLGNRPPFLLLPHRSEAFTHSAMDWVKIIHILCVMGWMTSIFAVPRALIYWRREWERSGEFGPLGDLTIRLYRFSAGLAVIAILTGLWLAWSVWGFQPWVQLKLALVMLLAAHYVWTGALVLRARRGNFGHSDLYLRIFNEISVLGAIAVLWVVVVKPF